MYDEHPQHDEDEVQDPSEDVAQRDVIPSYNLAYDPDSVEIRI